MNVMLEKRRTHLTEYRQDNSQLYNTPCIYFIRI